MFSCGWFATDMMMICVSFLGIGMFLILFRIYSNTTSSRLHFLVYESYTH